MEVQSFEEGAIVQFSVKSHGSVIFIGKVKRFIPATVSSSPTYRIECRNGRTVDIVPASLTRVEGVVELTLCPAETQAQYQLQVSVAGESRLLCLGEKVEYNIKDGLPSLLEVYYKNLIFFRMLVKIL